MTDQPNWAEAPEGATHRSLKSGNYYRVGATGDYHAQVFSNGYWATAKAPASQLDNESVFERLVAIDWSLAPADATHWRDGRFYKAGPNYHARMWGTYKGAPAWIAATYVHNTDLGKPFYQPRPTTALTPAQEAFTMSAEEAKQLATDKRPMQIVVVTFTNQPDAKEYHYYAPAEAKAGQYAVVYASNTNLANSAFPFGVVKIVRDNVLDVHGRATKAILASFDEEFAKHVQARMEHMARVKAQLQQKKKQFEENAIFEMLAQKDPEAAALLEELKSFNL